MSRTQSHQTGSVHHPNSNINLDEVGEGESLESKMVLPDDFDDVIKDMVSGGEICSTHALTTV